MRILQRLVLLVTLATLPVYGPAGVMHRSCQEPMSSVAQATLVGDCCPGKLDQNTSCDQDGKTQTGKNHSHAGCKTACSCSSAQLYEPTSSRPMWAAPARGERSAHRPTPPSSHSPDGLWRPPRLI